jgi:hypothetical protein
MTASHREFKKTPRGQYDVCSGDGSTILGNVNVRTRVGISIDDQREVD